MANFLNRLFKKQTKETVVETPATPEVSTVTLMSPIAGRALPLSEVQDAVFSQELMGKGIAIEPTEGKVVSPINGTVMMVFDTYHAIGLQSDEGVEVLIHFGMDTVELKGTGFTPHVKAGVKVSVGDLLLEADLDVINAAGYSTVTPIIVTNTHDYSEIQALVEGPVAMGDALVTVTK